MFVILLFSFEKEKLLSFAFAFLERKSHVTIGSYQVRECFLQLHRLFFKIFLLVSL